MTFSAPLLPLLLAAAAWTLGPATPAPAAAGERSLSLQEAYGLALRRSEDLASRRESLAEALARVDELLAAVKPSIKLQGTELVQDVPDSSNGVSSSFNQRSRFDARVMGHQPLFAGFREFLAYKAAKAAGRSVSLDNRRAEALLFQDVAGAYARLLGLHKELATRQAVLGLLRERLGDLKSRAAVGRSRRAELLAAEFQLADLEAQLEGARGDERAEQEALRFLTGLEDDLRPQDLPTPAPEPLEGLLQAAESREDVRARRLDLDGSRWLALAARRQRWPTIGVDGNYYLHRSGVQEGVRWDLLFTGELPLYSGGSIAAQAKEADARRGRAEQAFSLALRRARREIKEARLGLSSALSRLGAREKAASLAEANAKAQAQDYRMGLTTNLEVLSSLSSLQQARLDADRARLDAALARLKLDAAAGRTP